MATFGEWFVKLLAKLVLKSSNEMPMICLMVRENHKMVREMSGKSQGILWGLMAGHPEYAYPYQSLLRKFSFFRLFQYILCN